MERREKQRINRRFAKPNRSFLSVSRYNAFYWFRSRIWFELFMITNVSLSFDTDTRIKW